LETIVSHTARPHANAGSAGWLAPIQCTFTVVLLTTMGTLRIFDLMWIMTQGGPAHATETIATYIFTNAFRFQRVGYAQSLAFMLLAVVVGLTLLLTATLRRRANLVAG
jgi:raffinose/stachyose/melibiose transport system permease protein